MSQHPTFYNMYDRQSNASNEAKQAFLVRKDDIDLGKWWNAMRLNQRQIAWRESQFQQQMGYAQMNHINEFGLSNLQVTDNMMNSILGRTI